MSATELKRTPLFDTHQAAGAKVIPFAGWEMPVQYSGLIAEHQAVRTAAGLFDVSHMGEIEIEGSEALNLLEQVTCNRVSNLTPGKAQYSALLNESGGVVDDLIIYCFSPTKYLLCVNASNAEKDFHWIRDHNTFDTDVTNRSPEFGQIAVQGPRSAEILSKLIDVESIEFFGFAERTLCEAPAIVARTGYTGEDGFEIFIPTLATRTVWNTILEQGESAGLIPCGLGARDTLRLEACFPLHGHELSETFSALESGLGWIVKLDKGDFIGRDALIKEKETGSARKLVGFFVEGKGIVREGAEIEDATGTLIGSVTSGTKTPSFSKALGIALVTRKSCRAGDPARARVRNRLVDLTIVKMPFYQRGKRLYEEE